MEDEAVMGTLGQKILQIPKGPTYKVLTHDNCSSILMYNTLKDLDTLESLHDEDEVILDGKTMKVREAFNRENIGRDYIARSFWLNVTKQQLDRQLLRK